MKYSILTVLIVMIFIPCCAQSDNASSQQIDIHQNDYLSSELYLYNKEYDTFIKIDVTNKNIKVPGQEVFGEMVGYLKNNGGPCTWLIPSAEIDNKNNRILLDMVNDYGSEDLVATLTYNPKDSTYTFKQGEGSTIRLAKNRKWIKLPKTLIFVKK